MSRYSQSKASPFHFAHHSDEELEDSTPRLRKSTLGKRQRLSVSESPPTDPSSPPPESASKRHHNTRRQVASSSKTSTSSSKREIAKEDHADKDRPIDRGRATSSLISDNSNGEPYEPERSVSLGVEVHKSLFVSPLPKPPLNRRKIDKAKVSASHQPSAKPARTAAVMDIDPRATPSPLTTMKSPFDFAISAPDPQTLVPFPEPEPEVQQAPQGRPAKRRARTVAPVTASAESLAEDGTPALETVEHEAEGGKEFFETYNEVLKTHQTQTDRLNELHNAHEKSVKRSQNLASRRKTRIEKLERENNALRRSLTTGEKVTATSIEYEERLNSANRTIEMLTGDLAEREKKYATSQASLRSTTEDAQTFERKYQVAQDDVKGLRTQLEEMKERLENAHEGICAGSRQLKNLQKLMTKVDREIVKKVRTLAELSGEWDRRGGADDGLRARVAAEMTELVNAWRKFEGTYEEGVKDDERDA